MKPTKASRPVYPKPISGSLSPTSQTPGNPMSLQEIRMQPQPQSPLALNANSVLVKPEVGAAQIAAETVSVSPVPATTTETYIQTPIKSSPTLNEHNGANTLEPATVITPPTSILSPGHVATSVTAEQQFHRFYGSAKINPRVMAVEAGKR